MTTAAAARTGIRPASTAALTGALAVLPNACATATSCPAPPERVDGAWWRTHCVAVMAADPPEVSPRSIASPTTATLAAAQAVPSPSSSPSSGPRSAPPARHSSVSRPCSAARAAAICASRSSSVRVPSMRTTLEVATDSPR